MRLRAFLAAALAVLLSAAPAAAQTTMLRKPDNTGNYQAATETTAAAIDGHVDGLEAGLGAAGDAAWSGSGSGSLLAVEKYVAAKVEASRALLAGTLTVGLPSGAATSAKQDSLLTALGSPFQAGGSIGNTTFGATQSGTWNLTNISGTVSLPTGAATSAAQASLLTALGSPYQAGGALPLPSGASTAANQTTANTKLDTIATSTAADATNNGAFTTATALTVGASDAAVGRSIAMVCTGAGDVSLKLSVTAAFVVPAAVGLTILPFGAVGVNTSGTTGVCTYANLN